MVPLNVCAVYHSITLCGVLIEALGLTHTLEYGVICGCGVAGHRHGI